MNIKEHIEAGHYPKDGPSGGWDVVLRNNTVAKIFTATCGGRYPLVGVVSIAGRGWVAIQWDAEGCPERDSGSHWGVGFDLLPPPPRKVKVTAYARVATSGDVRQFTRLLDSLRIPTAPAVGHDDVIVELTGEYDEPWS